MFYFLCVLLGLAVGGGHVFWLLAKRHATWDKENAYNFDKVEVNLRRNFHELSVKIKRQDMKEEREIFFCDIADGWLEPEPGVFEGGPNYMMTVIGHDKSIGANVPDWRYKNLFLKNLIEQGLHLIVIQRFEIPQPGPDRTKHNSLDRLSEESVVFQVYTGGKEASPQFDGVDTFLLKGEIKAMALNFIRLGYMDMYRTDYHGRGMFSYKPNDKAKEWLDGMKEEAIEYALNNKSDIYSKIKD